MHLGHILKHVFHSQDKTIDFLSTCTQGSPQVLACFLFCNLCVKIVSIHNPINLYSNHSRLPTKANYQFSFSEANHRELVQQFSNRNIPMHGVVCFAGYGPESGTKELETHSSYTTTHQPGPTEVG